METATMNRVAGDNGGLIPAPASRDANIEVAASRAAQEVMAAMTVAKKFPRNENEAWQRIMRSCKRKTLAEQAIYAYPKGGKTVTGPSIRLAEAMAQAWGNIDFGIIELEQKNGESAVMSYAWDLETNTRQTKIFTIKHERHTKSGSYALNDPRDIYEMTANQGARRLRACILGVIPGDVVDSALDECEKTMAGNNTEPLGDRIRKMLAAFSDMGITQEMVERRLGHKAEAIIEAELVSLRKIFQSLKDNMAAREDFFEVKPGLAERLEKKVDPDAHEQPSAQESQEQPAMSDLEKFEVTLHETAEAVGIDEKQLANGVKKYLLKLGKVGKPQDLTGKERDELLAAVKGKQGYFAV